MTLNDMVWTAKYIGKDIFEKGGAILRGTTAGLLHGMYTPFMAVTGTRRFAGRFEDDSHLGDSEDALQKGFDTLTHMAIGGTGLVAGGLYLLCNARESKYAQIGLATLVATNTLDAIGNYAYNKYKWVKWQRERDEASRHIMPG